jgi:sugar (pentulose or hexulose) kinase
MESSSKPFLSLDIGAGSGRAFLGFINKEDFRIEEVHRFKNKPILLHGSLYWDLLFIWENILEALRKCAGWGNGELAGIGVDTWNLDFGLIDKNGMLLGNPISYRDQGNAEILSYFKDVIEEDELYRITGFGFSMISGLSRLLQLKKSGRNWLLDKAATYLPISDLLRFFLTGTSQAEATILWGSQLIDIRTRKWNEKLIKLFQIPTHILPEIVAPGTVTGNLTLEIQKHSGVNAVPVVAVAGHDTISAFAAFCTEDRNTAFLSVGTWSILGVLVRDPITNQEVMKGGFMNEIAVDSILLAKNMMGFYFLEALIRIWSLRGIDCSWESLIMRASHSPEFTLIIDVNDSVFFSSANMEDTLNEYLRETRQELTNDSGVLSRSIFESLAFSYRDAISDFERQVRINILSIVILGGGTKNRLLCQMIADAANIQVVTGPSEASVIGNLGLQALATGALNSMDNFHKLVQMSYSAKNYFPKESEKWEVAAAKRRSR